MEKNQLGIDNIESKIVNMGARLFHMYDVTDSIIITYLHLFNKSILLEQALSDNLVLYFLNTGYIRESDLYNLTMATHANLSEKTVNNYRQFLDLDKMISYQVATGTIGLDQIQPFMDNNPSQYMLDTISTCYLNKEFLLKYRKIINWTIFLKTNIISDDIREEFNEEINSVRVADNDFEKYMEYSIERINKEEYDDSIDEIIEKNRLNTKVNNNQ